MSRKGATKGSLTWFDGGLGTKLGRTESEEHIVGNVLKGGSVNMPMEVWHTTVVKVGREAVGGALREKTPMGSENVVGIYDGWNGSGSVTIVTANTTSVVPRMGTISAESP
jgi:hypothetical protein